MPAENKTLKMDNEKITGERPDSDSEISFGQHSDYAVKSGTIHFQKFKDDGTISASCWIKLLEKKLTVMKVDAEQFICFIDEYLEGNALNWYINKFGDTEENLTWSDFKKEFLKQFETLIADPFSSFIHRRFNFNETLEDYFKDKTRLALLAKLSTSQVISGLNDGLPRKFQPYLAMTDFQDTDEWLRKMFRLEQALKMSTFSSPKRTFRKPDASLQKPSFRPRELSSYTVKSANQDQEN